MRRLGAFILYSIFSGKPFRCVILNSESCAVDESFWLAAPYNLTVAEATGGTGPRSPVPGRTGQQRDYAFVATHFFLRKLQKPLESFRGGKP